MSDHKAKHTAGLWTAVHGEGTNPCWYVQRNSKTVVRVIPSSDNKRGVKSNNREAEANAHLIAAAPELLEFCEKMSNGLLAGEWIKLSSVIAKAKGNTNG